MMALTSLIFLVLGCGSVLAVAAVGIYLYVSKRQDDK